MKIMCPIFTFTSVVWIIPMRLKCPPQHQNSPHQNYTVTASSWLQDPNDWRSTSNFLSKQPNVKTWALQDFNEFIPQDIIEKYNFMDKKIIGFFGARVEKGMYDILQDIIISHESLKEHVRPFSYESVTITLGIWLHKKNGITFTLVVEKSDIKYQRKEDVQHLINKPQEKYDASTAALHWNGTTRQVYWKSQFQNMSRNPSKRSSTPLQSDHSTP